MQFGHDELDVFGYFVNASGNGHEAVPLERQPRTGTEVSTPGPSGGAELMGLVHAPMPGWWCRSIPHWPARVCIRTTATASGQIKVCDDDSLPHLTASGSI
jgi:hypothetical protein